MSRAPAFQFYPDKWQSHTRRLSDQSYRVYHELLCWMWQSSDDYCSVQNSPEAIACAIAMQTECVRIALAEIQNPFSPLLKEENGRLVSNGLKKARQAQLDKSHKAKEAANARWKDANAMQTHKPSNAQNANPQCTPSPTPTPTPFINTSTPQTPPVKPQRTSDESPEFLSFWEAYPRKESKPQAERAFRKAMKLTTLSEILKAIERFREVWKQSDPRYTPLPASWLNGHRWNDEPAKPSQPTQSGKPNWLRIKELKEIIRQLEGQLHSHMDRERNPGKLEQLKAAQAELAKLEPLP